MAAPTWDELRAQRDALVDNAPKRRDESDPITCSGVRFLACPRCTARLRVSVELRIDRPEYLGFSLEEIAQEMDEHEDSEEVTDAYDGSVPSWRIDAAIEPGPDTPDGTTIRTAIAGLQSQRERLAEYQRIIDVQMERLASLYLAVPEK